MTLTSLFERTDDGSEGAAEIVAALVGDLHEAKYHFLKVVEEHPRSMWRSDAATKMRQIDSMLDRYRKIVQSYRNEERNR